MIKEQNAIKLEPLVFANLSPNLSVVSGQFIYEYTTLFCVFVPEYDIHLWIQMAPWDTYIDS